MATALQLKRQGIGSLLFEKGEPGGLLKNARTVENVMGFPGGISGIDLIDLFKKQLERFDIRVVSQAVVEIGFDGETGVLSVKTGGGQFYSVNVVVVASGTRPKEWDLMETLPDSLQDQIYYEVYPFRDIRDKHVVVIGAGDAAFDYALTLAKRNEVLILNRGSQIRALPLLRDWVKQKSRIRYMAETVVESVEPGLKKPLNLICNQKGREISWEADAVLCALGRQPEKRFYSTALSTSEKRLIKQKRLFLVGDVRNDRFRQVSIAVGNGIEAAMEIYHQRGRK